MGEKESKNYFTRESQNMDRKKKRRSRRMSLSMYRISRTTPTLIPRAASMPSLTCPSFVHSSIHPIVILHEIHEHVNPEADAGSSTYKLRCVSAKFSWSLNKCSL